MKSTAPKTRKVITSLVAIVYWVSLSLRYSARHLTHGICIFPLRESISSTGNIFGILAVSFNAPFFKSSSPLGNVSWPRAGVEPSYFSITAHDFPTAIRSGPDSQITCMTFVAISLEALCDRRPYLLSLKKYLSNKHFTSNAYLMPHPGYLIGNQNFTDWKQWVW